MAQNDTKSCMTLMMCGVASGVLLPPHFIFKSTKLFEPWMENAPLNSAFGVSRKGWMDGPNMLGFLEKIVIPYTQGLKNNKPRILLLDNYK